MKNTFWVLVVICTGCIEFSMSDEDAKTELEEYEVVPSFGNLNVNGRNVHYVNTDNSKEVLAIFVHGSPGSWSAFIDFFKADSLLEKADILAIDRPGFGGSEKGKAEPSMEKQAFLLHEVAQQFSHRKKILIGHSLGGPVIARMAMDYPNSYTGLVFAAASIDPEMEKDEWYRNVIDTRVGGALTPGDFEVSNDEILPLKGELTHMLPLWTRINIPSVVIHGTDDSLVPKENVDFIQRMLPDSLLDVRLLEGVDHFIPWSHPKEIIGAIYRLAEPQ